MLDAFDGLEPEERLLGETVRAFARAVIAPGATERDEAERFDRSIFRAMAELGLLAGPFPESVGGGRPVRTRLDDRHGGDRRGGHGRRGDPLASTS